MSIPPIPEGVQPLQPGPLPDEPAPASVDLPLPEPPPTYCLAVDYRRLLTPALVCPGERPPRLYAADSLLVQMILGKGWPAGKFSLVEVDGCAVAIIEETPVAVLPIEEWRRKVIDYVQALKPAPAEAWPGHVVIELSALGPKDGH